MQDAMETIQRLGGLFGCCALPVLFFGAVIAGFIWLQVNARIPGGLGRRKKMKAAAAELGWTYVPSVPHTSIPAAGSLHLFINGSGHRIANLMSGARESAQMGLFDHQFQRGFNSRIIFAHTVLFTAPGLALPVFVLRAAQFLQRLGVAPTAQITFPNHPKFSTQFVLMGKDESDIRHLFTDAVLEFCEARPGLCLESVGGYLFMFRQGVFAPPHNLGMYFDEANVLLRLFASALSAERPAPPPLPPPTA